MESLPKQLIWLGCGTTSEPSFDFEEFARVVLVDARLDVCDLLSKSIENIEVENIVLAESSGSAIFNEFNVAQLSSTLDTSYFKSLLPNIEVISSTNVETLAISDFLSRYDFRTFHTTLIIDIPNIAMETVSYLCEAGRLDYLSDLIISFDSVDEGRNTELTKLISDTSFTESKRPKKVGIYTMYFYTYSKIKGEIRDAKVRANDNLNEEKLTDILTSVEGKLLTNIDKKLSELKSFFKNQLSSQSVNASKQIEAFIGLNDYLQHGYKPLNFHGWPISPDIALFLLNLLDTESYDAVIEYGSGTSTALISRGIKVKSAESNKQTRDSLFYSFEHSLEYFHKTKRLVNQHGGENHVELCHTPLVGFDFNGQKYSYYDCKAKLQELSDRLESESPRIMILVDGPPGTTNKHARFPALPILLEVFEGCDMDFVVDDFQRTEEKEIVLEWKKILSSKEIEFEEQQVVSEKGFTVLKIKSK